MSDNNHQIHGTSDGSKPSSPPRGLFASIANIKTPGVKNIEAAYSRAGGANNHLPGSATKLGSQDQKGNTAEEQGVGSQKFTDGFSDQRREEPSVVGKMFNNMINGTDKTK